MLKTTRKTHFGLTTLLALITLLFPAPQASADEQAFEPTDHWYVLKLGGAKAGHMHVRSIKQDDALVNTTAMLLSIKRGDTELRIEQASRFIESLDHKPLLAQSTMKLAAMATEQDLDFTTTPWTLSTTTAGNTVKTTMQPPDADWMTPGRLAMHLKQALEADKEQIKVTTFDLSTGPKPVEVTMKRAGEEDIEVFGKVVPATRWQTTMSMVPGLVMTQWSDDKGQPVRQTIPLLPGMEIEMLLADKALALAEFDAPEMLANTLITPDKRIKHPQKLKRAAFDLVTKGLKEKVGDAVPNAGFQRAKWGDADTLRITIDLDQPVRPKRFDIDEALLKASTMLNHEDKAVKELVEQCVDLAKLQRFGKFPTLEPLYAAQRDAALRMQQFVREHIDAKDLSVGFASASETARTKQGDCTEHACLLAAMLRGANIPSRTVTGLVYADQFLGNQGVFGFHMWTQAWIADETGRHRWVDLDAALPGDVNGFDATHIALATSAMNDGEGFNDMVTMLPLMQGLEIRVIETTWAD